MLRRGVLLLLLLTAFDSRSNSETPTALPYSPVDLALTPNGQSLLVVSQSADKLTLIRLADGRVVAQVPTGAKPTNVVLSADGKLALVSASYAGDVLAFQVDDSAITPIGKLHLKFEPRGLAIAPDGKRGYVALRSGGVIVEFSLPELKEFRRIEVGRWPCEIALNPDGSRLAVGCQAEGGIAVIDTVKGEKLYLEDFLGINLGQMQTSRDGNFVYFPWMVYRQLAITQNNIRQGWVMASRIARVRLDGPARREAISLDPQGQAIADPHGIALSADESHLYCTAGGTHELLMYRLTDLPLQDYGGPGDHIDKALLTNRERFDRLPLGGRPLGMRVAPNGHLFVANAFLGVQEVDPVEKKIVRTISLGPAGEPSMARRGEMIFFDGQRSLDQWYSCHSCHYEGHTNSATMDTKSDGRFGNFKSVLSLRNVTHTGPWFWHGWQKDLAAGIRKSMVDSMLGPEPNVDDVAALVAYLGTIKSPPNPNLRTDGSMTEEADRGKEVFHSAKANCVKCHAGPYYTDGKIHSVGLEATDDAYKGYNTPSLIGVYDRPRLLHDGRGKSIEDVLKKHHNPNTVVGEGELTPRELADLIAYLKSL